MDDNEKLGKLFFELSSENRLSILSMLSDEPYRMQEVANKLEITPTEVFRQLQRLTEIPLVERLPDGSYTISPYGSLVLHLSSGFNFISSNQEYFRTHDLWSIPPAFINRIGELGEAKLIMDAIRSINKSIQIFLEAEEYAWGLSESGGGQDHLDPLIDKQIEEGLSLRLLVPDKVLSEAMNEPLSGKVEVRGYAECPAVVVLSEKEAMVFFRFKDGRIDYTGFHSDDQSFMTWARDLFLYYWDSGRAV